MSESVSRYDEPDFSLGLSLPARSILFSLSPEGFGTSRQESLLSFLVRTSRAHAIGPRQLVRNVLAEIDPGITPIASVVFFRRLSATVNGFGTYAERFVAALECATGQSGLRHLTLLPWKHVFPHNGQGCLFRRPQWCPVCLAENILSGKTASMQLVWSLEAFHICPIHMTRLESQCPKCGKEQPFIPRYPDLAVCDYCSQILTSERSAESCDTSDVWMARAIADMIVQQPVLEPSLTAESFRNSVRKHVVAATDGNRAAYCRKLGINVRGLNGWLTKGERPSMAQFLTFCYGTGILPTALFSATSSPHTATLQQALHRKIKPRGSCRRLPLSERLHIEKHLRACLGRENPPPVSVIADEIGLRPGFLRYWFRDLCTQISERYKRAVLDRSTAYRARQCAIVEQIIAEVRLMGRYPSRRLVNQRLRSHGMALAQSHLSATYCKLVQVEKEK
jgi:hypothetical protein